MEWLAENWIWLLIGIAFIAMHLFGHGKHGGHGHGKKDNPKPDNQDKHSDDRP